MVCVSKRGVSSISKSGERPRLVHVLNLFRSGAVPNIIRDIHPEVSKVFDVEVVVLQGIHDKERATEEFRSLEVPITALNSKRLNLMDALCRLQAHLAERRPAIVHGHMGRAHLLTPFASPPGAKSLVTVHNTRDGYMRLMRPILALASRQLDHKVFISNAVRASWPDMGVDRFSVIYNPIDILRFEAAIGARERVREEFAIPVGGTLLITVGRLTRQKGHIYLIDAVAEMMARSDKSAYLLIVGRGEEEAAIRRRIKSRGVGDRIILTGFRNDIPDLVAASDLFVFPSIWEGLGLAALEAMAAGTAVAASALPAIKEYISSDETGYLFPPKDARAMADALIQAVDNPERREALGRAGQSFVKKVFNADRVGKAYLELYRSIMVRS